MASKSGILWVSQLREIIFEEIGCGDEDQENAIHRIRQVTREMVEEVIKAGEVNCPEGKQERPDWYKGAEEVMKYQRQKLARLVGDEDGK